MEGRKNGSKSARIASTTNIPSAPECCACCWHRQEPFRIKYLKLRKMHSSYFHVHYCRSYCNHNDCRFYRFLPLLRIMGHGFMCLSVWIPISLSLFLRSVYSLAKSWDMTFIMMPFARFHSNWSISIPFLFDLIVLYSTRNPTGWQSNSAPFITLPFISIVSALSLLMSSHCVGGRKL